MKQTITSQSLLMARLAVESFQCEFHSSVKIELNLEIVR